MEDLGALDAFAARVLRTGTATGLAVAITDLKRTVAARVYGDAAPDHLWPIASIGKSFTAALALALEGALDLHAPNSNYDVIALAEIGSRPASTATTRTSATARSAPFWRRSPASRTPTTRGYRPSSSPPRKAPSPWAPTGSTAARNTSCCPEPRITAPRSPLALAAPRCQGNEGKESAQTRDESGVRRGDRRPPPRVDAVVHLIDVFLRPPLSARHRGSPSVA